MSETKEQATTFMVREAVGVFDTAARLDTAVDELGLAGIGRRLISILGAKKSDQTAAGQPNPGASPRSMREMTDDPATPTQAFESIVSKREAQGMSVAIPMEIAGFGAAWTVAATGGALILAIGAVVASGAVGAGLGALVYYAVGRRHADAIKHHVANGGLILWVRIADDHTEQRALEVLRACGASNVHSHTISRPWGVEDIPFHNAQPDPFLEHGPV